jgi:hypothetical protein
MPGFRFEKIGPPEERKLIATPAANERRGPVVRMLQRFVELRVRRKLRTESRGATIRPERSED